MLPGDDPALDEVVDHGVRDQPDIAGRVPD
jgi:hypothetical protein